MAFDDFGKCLYSVLTTYPMTIFKIIISYTCVFDDSALVGEADTELAVYCISHFPLMIIVTSGYNLCTYIP